MEEEYYQLPSGVEIYYPTKCSLRKITLRLDQYIKPSSVDLDIAERLFILADSLGTCVGCDQTCEAFALRSEVGVFPFNVR